MGYQQTQLNTANKANGALELSLRDSVATINKMDKQAKLNQQAQAELIKQINAASFATARQKQQMERLKRELQDVKDWANTPLPLAISSLRERPAISGSKAYRNYVSKIDAVPITTQPPYGK